MTFSLFGDEMDDDAVEIDAEQPASAPAGPVRTLPAVAGHDRAEQFLWQAWQAGRLPHGLMFVGVQGIGKALFAQHVAAFLLSPPAFREGAQSLMAHDAGTASRIMARTHPDFSFSAREFNDDKGRFADTLNAAEIRKITPFLRVSAGTDNGWRVVIVDDADTMNMTAQNSILKILEEPPPQTVLILIAHRAGAFLPTIRSRCQVIGFDALDTPAFDRVARTQFPDAPPALLSMAAGRPGYLARLMDADFESVWSEFAAIVNDWPRLDPLALHRFADKMSPPEYNEKLHLLADTWVHALFLCARCAVRGETLPPYLSKGGPWPGLAASRNAGALARLHDEMKAHWNAVFGAALERRASILKAFVMMKALAPSV